MPITKSKLKGQNSNLIKSGSKIRKAKTEKFGEETSINSLIVNPLAQFDNFKKNLPAGRQGKFVIFAAVIILLAILVSYKKSWFVAAVVNNSPISNFEVLRQENSQYRKQVLDTLINEKLVLDAANKKGVKVSEKDINDKIAEIEKQVGGAAALDNLLTQQGQTRNSIRNEIKVTLALEKMYGPEITVTSDEVSKFIEQNKEQMQSSTPAELTKEANDILKSQKQNQIFSQKFQEIKKAANIQIF